MLLLFSERADDSEHVKRELMLAGRRRLPVSPLQLEDVQPVVLEYLLATPQWIDWIDRRDATLEALAHRLLGLEASEEAMGLEVSAPAAAFIGDGSEDSTQPDHLGAAAAQSFGAPAPDGVLSWPLGPYVRCHRNRLHLVSASGDGQCALCVGGGHE